MKSFLVTWKIDIEAETPEEAAIEALRIQQDMESEATHFEVKDKKTNKVKEVDAKTAMLKLTKA